MSEEAERSALAAAGVLDALPTGGDPRHHPAELLADLLDRVVLTGLLEREEVLAPRLALGDPLVGEHPVLDVAQDLLHARLDRVVDHDGTARQVAVLGGVADRVAHATDALLVHE